jgi:mono/diheme cytochrome c family protein
MERLVSRARRNAALAGLLTLGTAVALMAGCGGSSEPDLANGKQQFAACGGCHALAAAGTTATVGPNLDDAFRASRKEGFEESAFEGVIRYWIANPEQRTPPIMPANMVTGQDADDVAAYIASVAGRSPESPPRPIEPLELALPETRTPPAGARAP